ncbi:hypothetical protein G7Z17_g9943 [Cylindrodendrum hubeiense]|uniref:Uncharacterized protein n=1 Tax=Cylindrodendrum hubeiense TaxID=595255 RepID=A0A9P5H3L6_9HYPO|nr:hypothetical protein G7Z17_g9943 [Cylindrodendrum hubeiense]
MRPESPARTPTHAHANLNTAASASTTTSTAASTTPAPRQQRRQSVCVTRADVFIMAESPRHPVLRAGSMQCGAFEIQPVPIARAIVPIAPVWLRRLNGSHTMRQYPQVHSEASLVSPPPKYSARRPILNNAHVPCLRHLYCNQGVGKLSLLAFSANSSQTLRRLNSLQSPL